MYQQLGLTGARGEAEAGYPLVINHALPHYLTLLDQGLDPELALLDTLLLLMAINGDTNVASRGGEGGLRWLQREAQTLLQKGAFEPPPISIISGSSTGSVSNEISVQAAVPTC
ncbi:2-(5''-triphosphoribosyl)-3'-dephosphocoenzyme-A synthase [Escherichia coli]|nr:2-(5''-triphosphoribosyl)-3'-dephosphocoenzyme-A synthase [Escherichia coli]